MPEIEMRRTDTVLASFKNVDECFLLNFVHEYIPHAYNSQNKDSDNRQ